MKLCVLTGATPYLVAFSVSRFNSSHPARDLLSDDHINWASQVHVHVLVNHFPQVSAGAG